jgi:hypothetical protein
MASKTSVVVEFYSLAHPAANPRMRCYFAGDER